MNFPRRFERTLLGGVCSLAFLTAQAQQGPQDTLTPLFEVLWPSLDRQVGETLEYAGQVPLGHAPAKGLTMPSEGTLRVSAHTLTLKGADLIIKDFRASLTVASIRFEKPPILSVTCQNIIGHIALPELKIKLPEKIKARLSSNANPDRLSLDLSPAQKNLLEHFQKEVSSSLSGPVLAGGFSLQADCPAQIQEPLAQWLKSLLTQTSLADSLSSSPEFEAQFSKYLTFDLPVAISTYASLLPQTQQLEVHLQLQPSKTVIEVFKVSSEPEAASQLTPKARERVNEVFLNAANKGSPGVFAGLAGLNFGLERVLTLLTEGLGENFKSYPNKDGSLGYQWLLPNTFDASFFKGSLRETRSLDDSHKLQIQIRTLDEKNSWAPLNLVPWISRDGRKKGWDLVGKATLDLIHADSGEVFQTYFIGDMRWTLEHQEDRLTGTHKLHFLEAELSRPESSTEKDLLIPDAKFLPRHWLISLNWILQRQSQIDFLNEKFLSQYEVVAPKGTLLTWIGQATHRYQRPAGGYFAQGVMVRLPPKN